MSMPAITLRSSPAIWFELPRPLDAKLIQSAQRFPAPDPEQLRSLPPAYRRLILEYFDRLNRGRNEDLPEGRP